MMSKENSNYKKNVETKQNVNLDDEQRIKVLSPTMLVMKRFIRNRLAITGIVFIIGMFLFSFVGGWLMPYEEDQVFTKYEEMYKVRGGITVNEELKYIIVEDKEFPLIARSQFVLAVAEEQELFESEGKIYVQEKVDDDYYVIYGTTEIGISLQIGKDINISTAGEILSDEFITNTIEAIKTDVVKFEYDSELYYIVYGKKSNVIYRLNDFAISTRNIYNYQIQEIQNDYEFCKNAEITIRSNTSVFAVAGTEYTIDNKDGIYEIRDNDNNIYAIITRYQMEPIYEDVFFSLRFKEKLKDIIEEGTEKFTYIEDNGEEIPYRIYRQNLQWTLEHIEETYLIDEYGLSSPEHIMGTDGHGMDILTRLMYGGRISLRIGFIVVLISTFIGIVLGGVAGYFGKFWDNLIMRVVDVFNCIPSLPLVIILGAVMDQTRVPPNTRLNILMLILALLGWPGIARMVRGQTLSLREQEFMTATEATGIRVSKRIFKHLIPNIIPQLIVICTLSLGGVILTESVLSFLGVGVKFPFASWGNIINAVSNAHVMANYLFVWIPAGLCILITVLGFNFIGDGLRDAFDPKMKR